MNCTHMIQLHRIARGTGVLLAAMTLSSCSLEATPDAAAEQHGGATGEVETRHAKEARGRSVPFAGDEPQTAVPAAGDERAATADPMIAAAAAPLTAGAPCTTPDVIPPPDPALAEPAIVLPEQEKGPMEVPTDEEIRAHRVALDVPPPSEHTLTAQEQYLRDATTIRDQMGAADPDALEARLAERKAQLLPE